MADDPRRLFDAKDIEAAALYAKKVADTSNDFYPLKVDADGYLLTNLTVGTITAQLSSTASTITNSSDNPVNITGTVTTVLAASSTASTITNAAGNPVPVTGNINVATATLGTVTVTGTVSLSSTDTTINNSAANPVNVSLAATSVTINNLSANPVNVSLTNTQVSVSNSAGVFNVNVRTATLGTVTTSLSSTLVTVQNTAGVLNVSVRSATLGTVTVTGTVTLSTTAGTVTNSVSTIPIVGRTLTGSSGSITSTNASITATPTNRIKVYAISLTTTSATELICVLNSGGVANGLELWRATLMAPAGASAGLNLSVAPPNFLFASRSGTSVSLSLNTATLVHYSVSYFEEA